MTKNIDEFATPERETTRHSHTDCRDDVGITVNLLDSITTICRVLNGRDMSSIDVQEALLDMFFDEDFVFLCTEVRNTRIRHTVFDIGKNKKNKDDDKYNKE